MILALLKSKMVRIGARCISCLIRIWHRRHDEQQDHNGQISYMFDVYSPFLSNRDVNQPIDNIPVPHNAIPNHGKKKAQMQSRNPFMHLCL